MFKLNAKRFVPLVVSGLVVIWWMQRPHFVELQIKGQVIKVEIAETEIEKREGLMYREELEEDRGMLFVYQSPVPANFWMKNTLIPLDMIFIHPNKTINHIERDVPPCPAEVVDCPNYTSHEITQYVLEVNAGWSERHNIEVGDEVVFELHPTLQQIDQHPRRRVDKKGIELEVVEEDLF